MTADPTLSPQCPLYSTRFLLLSFSRLTLAIVGVGWAAGTYIKHMASPEAAAPASKPSRSSRSDADRYFVFCFFAALCDPAFSSKWNVPMVLKTLVAAKEVNLQRGVRHAYAIRLCRGGGSLADVVAFARVSTRTVIDSTVSRLYVVPAWCSAQLAPEGGALRVIPGLVTTDLTLGTTGPHVRLASPANPPLAAGQVRRAPIMSMADAVRLGKCAADVIEHIDVLRQLPRSLIAPVALAVRGDALRQLAFDFTLTFGKCLLSLHEGPTPIPVRRARQLVESTSATAPEMFRRFAYPTLLEAATTEFRRFFEVPESSTMWLFGSLAAWATWTIRYLRESTFTYRGATADVACGEPGSVLCVAVLRSGPAPHKSPLERAFEFAAARLGVATITVEIPASAVVVAATSPEDCVREALLAASRQHRGGSITTYRVCMWVVQWVSELGCEVPEAIAGAAWAMCPRVVVDASLSVGSSCRAIPAWVRSTAATVTGSPMTSNAFLVFAAQPHAFLHTPRGFGVIVDYRAALPVMPCKARAAAGTEPTSGPPTPLPDASILHYTSPQLVPLNAGDAGEGGPIAFDSCHHEWRYRLEADAAPIIGAALAALRWLELSTRERLREKGAEIVKRMTDAMSLAWNFAMPGVNTVGLLAAVPAPAAAPPPKALQTRLAKMDISVRCVAVPRRGFLGKAAAAPVIGSDDDGQIHLVVWSLSMFNDEPDVRRLAAAVADICGLRPVAAFGGTDGSGGRVRSATAGVSNMSLAAGGAQPADESNVVPEDTGVRDRITGGSVIQCQEAGRRWTETDPRFVDSEILYAPRTLAARLDLFLARYDPGRLDDAAYATGLRRRYAGNEQQLLDLLAIRYGPEPSSGEFRTRVEWFLLHAARKRAGTGAAAVGCSNLLSKTASMLEAFSGRGAELLTRLEERFGPEPIPLHPEDESPRRVYRVSDNDVPSAMELLVGDYLRVFRPNRRREMAFLAAVLTQRYTVDEAEGMLKQELGILPLDRRSEAARPNLRRRYLPTYALCARFGVAPKPKGYFLDALWGFASDTFDPHIDVVESQSLAPREQQPPVSQSWRRMPGGPRSPVPPSDEDDAMPHTGEDVESEFACNPTLLRVYRQYLRYCPDRAWQAKPLLESWRGKEGLLLAALVAKYGPEPAGPIRISGIDVPKRSDWRPLTTGDLVRHFYSATQQSVEDAMAAESGALEEAALAIQSRRRSLI